MVTISYRFLCVTLGLQWNNLTSLTLWWEKGESKKELRSSSQWLWCKKQQLTIEWSFSAWFGDWIFYIQNALTIQLLLWTAVSCLLSWHKRYQNLCFIPKHKENIDKNLFFFPAKQNYSFPVEWCCSTTLNHTTHFTLSLTLQPWWQIQLRLQRILWIKTPSQNCSTT